MCTMYMYQEPISSCRGYNVCMYVVINFHFLQRIIGLVCYYQRAHGTRVPHKKMDQSHNNHQQDPDYGREVVNPLSIEPGFDSDEDEDTKKLQDLIEESQLK